MGRLGLPISSFVNYLFKIIVSKFILFQETPLRSFWFETAKDIWGRDLGKWTISWKSPWGIFAAFLTFLLEILFLKFIVAFSLKSWPVPSFSYLVKFKFEIRVSNCEMIYRNSSPEFLGANSFSNLGFGIWDS